MAYKTEQEIFWAGEFGNKYIGRNLGEATAASNTALFSRILRSTKSISTIIEFGANIGLNLRALRRLLPEAEMSAIEINENAVAQLRTEPGDIKIYHSSILNFQSDKERDLVLIKGVLIHINPDELQNVYKLLYESSRRYICIAEYYNPSPVELRYRGHEGKLFKRDFAGELMEKFPRLELIDYGFVYHKDSNFPQDDITWFLLEKQ